MTQDNHSQDKLSEIRTQAEAVLLRKEFDVLDVSALSTEEIQDLVHELHVHQIELELQNVDLRQSQIKLEELKDRYLDMYDFAPVGYMTLNDKGLILEANLTAVRLLGVERTSLVKMFLSYFVCQEFVNPYYSYLKQVFESQSEQTCEIKLTRKDGTVFYAQLVSLLVQDESGELNRCRTILTDITERKRVEEELRISEEKFSKAFQINSDGITITRLVDGVFVSVNEGFKHLSGYPEEEVIGKTSLELNILANPEDRNRLIEVLKAEGKVDNFEAGFRIKNGDVRYGLMSASIIVLNGEPHILNVTKDITKLKLVEDQLRKSEEKYRLLAENMNDVIWQTTPDMVFTYVSPSIKQQRGYEASEVLGTPIWDFIDPNEILSWRNRVKLPFNILLSCEAAFKTEPYELHVRKDGTTLWTETMTTPVINDEGNLIAFQGVTRDVTERKLLEDALRTTLGRYHIILSSLYAGVLVVAEDGRVEFANQAFCDLFHLEDLPENLRGMSSPAMIQKIKDVYAQPADTVSRIQAIVAHGDPVKGEEIAMRYGRVYMVDYIAIYIDGKPCGRLWHHQDITERKWAEDALRSYNQKFSVILNALDAFVYVTDMKTYEIVFINTYGQNIWGDIKGSICWQTIQDNQAGPCEFCTNSQLIGPDGNPTEGVDWEFQNTVNNRWYDCRDRAIYWPDGRIVRMEIATDITERKQAEKGEGEFEVSASPVPKNGGYRNFF